jgi:hypothetical protein
MKKRLYTTKAISNDGSGDELATKAKEQNQ